MRKVSLVRPGVLVMALTLFFGATAWAASNSNLSQVINTGSLSTDIKDDSRNSVASPSVSMAAKTFSFDCYAGGTASAGTLGAPGQNIYVTNPDGADNGWTLAIAATGGPTSLWQNGGSTQNFDYNDNTGTTAGCTDPGASGLDTDLRPGQLSVSPSGATITTDCSGCTTTGVTLGSNSAFLEGTVTSITLVNAAAGSNDIWRGYLRNVGLSQTIPAEQAADTYTLNLTLTSTAL